MSWKYTDESKRVVKSIDGLVSCSVSAPEVQTYLAAGGVIEPAFTIVEYKTRSVEKVNAECKQRIFKYWPVEEQATAIDGGYGADALLNMRLWRTGHLNVADDAQLAINAIVDSGNLDKDIADIDAIVAAVVWPVWGV